MAVRFDASTDFYSATTGLPTSTTYTVVAWIYISTDRNDFSNWCEIRQSTSANNPALYIGTDTDGTTAQLSTNASSLNSTASTLVVGQWCKVAVTVNGSAVALFVGPNLGTLVKNTATFSGLPSSFAELHLGGDEWGTFFNGRLAGVKMWTSVLSDAEIAAEFTQFQPVKTSTLRRYHRFSSASTADDSGNGFTLTAGSTSTTTEADPAGVPEVAVTPVSSSDSGTGSASATIAATVSLTDSGTGSETLAVLRASSLSDSGTGADLVDVLRASTVTDSGSGAEVLDVTPIEYVSVSDSGTGAELVDVLIPVLKSVSDSGVGTDSVTGQVDAAAADSATGSEAVALARSSSVTDSGAAADIVDVLRASSSSDSGAGSDALLLVRLSTVVDSGVGSESIAILRFSTVTETGAAADTFSGGPFVVDSGVGSESITIVDIPYTVPVVLRHGTVYDVVVVARVPQIAGPPTFIEVDPVEWGSLTWVDTLSRPQQLTATCLKASLTESIRQRLRSPARLATELWCYRNGKLVFAGPVRGYRTDRETLTLEARGLLDYLRQFVIASDKRFDQADQFAMAQWMVDQWQALDYGHYGIDTSSVGASGKLRDGTYLAAELHNVGQRVQDLGERADGFDAEVDPATRKLQLWYPGKGVDRSTGEDAIVVDARNITSGNVMCSLAPDDVATEAFGASGTAASDSVLYSVRSNTELRAVYGRSGVSASWYDISEQATLDDHTQGLLDARADALIVPGPDLRITPDADLEAYGEGDTIAYQVDDEIGVMGAFRIRSRKITARPTGQETATLEFV